MLASCLGRADVGGVPEGMSLKASDVGCCPEVEAAFVEGDGTEDIGLIRLVDAAAGGPEGRVTFDKGEGRGWVGALLSVSLVLLLVGLRRFGKLSEPIMLADLWHLVTWHKHMN